MNWDIGFEQVGEGFELSLGITGHFPVPSPAGLFRSRRIAPGNRLTRYARWSREAAPPMARTEGSEPGHLAIRTFKKAPR